eukprot:6212341-Pleurochrysis_carterae.AAC.3
MTAAMPPVDGRSYKPGHSTKSCQSRPNSRRKIKVKREETYSCLARPCGVPRALLITLGPVPSLTHHSLHLLSSSGKHDVDFSRGIGLALPDHTVLPMTIVRSSTRRVDLHHTGGRQHLHHS